MDNTLPDYENNNRKQTQIQSQKLPQIKQQQQRISSENSQKTEDYVKLPSLAIPKTPNSLNDFSNNSFTSSRISNYIKPLKSENSSKSNQKTSKKREKSSTSLNSDGTKKIIKWHVWWDKPDSLLRVPSYALPPKDVPSRIGSLERINHKPGGGNVNLINEKLRWNTSARTDHLAKGYKPGGGQRRIRNDKLIWKTSSKIGSLENITHLPGGGNVEIIDQPFDKSHVRPKIDSGLVYEEMFVPIDYEVKSSPRPNYLEPIREKQGSRRSIRNQ